MITFIVNTPIHASTERCFDLSREVGYRFFGERIRDCLDGTEKAMPQAHTLKATGLCVRAQMQSQRISIQPLQPENAR